MITCGLTGGIGSGKSTISQIFKQLGVPVFDSDREAKNLSSDPKMVNQLVSLLGNEILNGSQLDRIKLSQILFYDSNSLKKVNELIHPKVREAFMEWAGRHRDQDLVIQEAAILFETGTYKQLDINILVITNEAIRIQRVMQRDGLNEEQVRARMRNQWSDDRKLPMADFVIDNNGLTPVLPQVVAIFENLKKMGNGKIR